LTYTVIGSIIKTLLNGFNLPKTLTIITMQGVLGLLLTLLLYTNEVEVFQARTAMKAGYF
jgi:hypothetical protein